MTVVADDGRDPGGRLPRFSFVVGVVSAILVLQLLAVALVGFLVERDAESATEDAFNYIGDATTVRVVHFLEPAQRLVFQTAYSLENGFGSEDPDELAEHLFEEIHFYPQLAGIFVGYPNGDFVFVRQLVTGFEVKIISAEPERRVTVYLYDDRYTLRSFWVLTDDMYDPRARVWYEDASRDPHAIWTDPYVFHSSGAPGVTMAQAVYGEDGEIKAVVGADIELSEISTFLDGLPVGSDGEAFVLTGEREVIAAPSRYDELVVAARGEAGLTVSAEALGLELPALPEEFNREIGVFGRNGDYVTLERGFPRESLIGWTIHLRATEAGLSPGIGSFQRTSLWYSGAIALLVLAASFLVYQLRHPLVELQARASTDDLTRLANRYEFRRRGQVMVDAAYERAEPICVAMFDLDDFKRINDTDGHSAGDRALRTAADSLRDGTGPDDLVARFGGDEFVVVRLVGDVAVPYQAVERIRDHMERGINKRRRPGEMIGVTAGFALSGPDYRDLKALAQAADAALVAGKRAGKGQTHGADDASEGTERRRSRSKIL